MVTMSSNIIAITRAQAHLVLRSNQSGLAQLGLPYTHHPSNPREQTYCLPLNWGGRYIFLSYLLITYSVSLVQPTTPLTYTCHEPGITVPKPCCLSNATYLKPISHSVVLSIKYCYAGNPGSIPD